MLEGGDGDDILDGGTGADIMIGGQEMTPIMSTGVMTK